MPFFPRKSEFKRIQIQTQNGPNQSAQHHKKLLHFQLSSPHFHNSATLPNFSSPLTTSSSMATTAFRAIGGKCRALMEAAKSSSTTVSSAASGGAAKKPKRPSSAGTSSTKGILKPVPISPTLSHFIGAPEASRTEAVKKVWDHIKLHNLRNPSNKREIICDEELKVLFSGKEKVGFLEIAKLLAQHFVKKA